MYNKQGACMCVQVHAQYDTVRIHWVCARVYAQFICELVLDYTDHSTLESVPE